MNVDEILKSDRSSNLDYYTILGCDENSSEEQISTEYKIRAMELHPDKHPDIPNICDKFQELQEAKNTLTDPEKRKTYDKWRNSGISISFKQWQGLREHVHTSMHWVTPKTKDRMLGEGDSAQSSTADASNRRGPHSGPPGISAEKAAAAPLLVGTKDELGWKSEASDHLSKFRTYEI